MSCSQNSSNGDFIGDYYIQEVAVGPAFLT